MKPDGRGLEAGTPWQVAETAVLRFGFSRIYLVLHVVSAIVGLAMGVFIIGLGVFCGFLGFTQEPGALDLSHQLAADGSLLRLVRKKQRNV